MHIRKTRSMLPEVVTCFLTYMYTFKRPAAVFPYPHVPAAAKASTMLSLASILASVSISYRVHAHATSERDTPAVVFRSCLLPRLLFEFTRRVPI